MEADTGIIEMDMEKSTWQMIAQNGGSKRCKKEKKECAIVVSFMHNAITGQTSLSVNGIDALEDFASTTGLAHLTTGNTTGWALLTTGQVSVNDEKISCINLNNMEGSLPSDQASQCFQFGKNFHAKPIKGLLHPTILVCNGSMMIYIKTLCPIRTI